MVPGCVQTAVYPPVASVLPPIRAAPTRTMSTNQIKRLRVMLRQSHTDPSWVKRCGWEARKTADQLVTGKLDWDGRESPPPGPPRYGREVILAQKSWSALDELGGDLDVPQKHRHKSAFAQEKGPSQDPTALEEENLLLKRQLEVLMGQVASGQHKLPQLNLSKVPRPPSGKAANAFLTEANTERPSAHRRLVLRPDFDGVFESGTGTQTDGLAVGTRQPSGSQTDRARPHAPVLGVSIVRQSAIVSGTASVYAAKVDELRPRRTSSRASRGHGEGLSSHGRYSPSHGKLSPYHHGRGNEHAVDNPFHATANRREVELALDALQHDLDTLRVQHKISQDKVWGLEDCLSVKDAELSIKDAELNHLRYLHTFVYIDAYAYAPTCVECLIADQGCSIQPKHTLTCAMPEKVLNPFHHACMHACIHTYIHAYTHTYTNTFLHA